MKLFRFGLFFAGFWLVCLGFTRPAFAAPVTSSLTAGNAVWHDVSCPSDDFCLAVGAVGSSGSSRPATLVNQSGQWHFDTALQPLAKFDSAQLDAVSCSSASFCMAVGTFTTTAQGWRSWAATWSKGKWELVNSSTFDQTAIDDISCVAEFCLAAGSVSQSVVTNQARVFAYTNGIWQRLSDTRLDSLGNLTAVKCFTMTDCLLAGSTGSITDGHYVLARYLGNNWTVNQAFAPTGAGYFRDLACQNQQACWLLGTNLKTGGRVVASWHNGIWAELGQSVGASQYPGNIWQSVGCLATGCFLAGQSSFPYGSSPAGRAIIDRLDGSNWQTDFVEPPNSQGDPVANTPSSRFWKVDCGPKRCLALGQYYHQGQASGFAAVFNGHWTSRDLDGWLNSIPSQSSQIAATLPVKAGLASLSQPLEYVAFGDSITTGHSISSCIANRQESAWGCSGSPATKPYPQRLAEQLNLKLDRVGIWGYTAREAAIDKRSGRNRQGEWQPQLLAVEQANRLVTGSLGINDLHFSDVAGWLKRYLLPGDQVTLAAQQIITARSADFDQIFASLVKARQNGSQVIVTLYYNPYDSDQPFCGDLEKLGQRITDALDAELADRAHRAGVRVVDLRPGFHNHGAATAQPYVFGDQCRASSALADWLPDWAGGGGGKRQLARHFDPHPNDAGAEAIEELILNELS